MKYFYIVEGTVRNNIGDVLQGMSAAQFLDEDAMAVDREKLSCMDKEYPGFLLATGWFMHDYTFFPPPPNITPFYISIHVANSDFLRHSHIREHFRKYGPVGCRDNKTMLLFLGWGIPAYYSGCLTITTTGRITINKDHKGAVLMVDNIDHPVPEEVLEKIEQLLQKKIERVSHDPNDVSLPFEDYVRSSTARMQSLLNHYCDSYLVITTKIHCALPCLGMGANVVLIHPNPSDPRLQTVRQFMEIISYNELLKSDTFKQPKKKAKTLLKQRLFITNLVLQAVKNQNNPICNPDNFYHWYIKIYSIISAFMFRIIILFLLKTGLANTQVKRVFTAI